MKEEFKSSNVQDFRQRYLGTYGWFDGKNDKVLCRIIDVTTEYVVFEDKKGMKYTANPDFGNTFTFLPVTKGVYHAGSDIILVQRHPARQYKRGICYENTRLISFNYRSEPRVSFDVLEQIFGQSETNFLEMFRQGKNDKVVLDNIFSIHNGEVRIFYHTLGYYYPDKRMIKLSEQLFAQELSDSIRNNQLDIVVT